MTPRRTVVIDSTAPIWAKHLETDLNGVLAGIAADADAAAKIASDAVTALSAVVSAAVPIGHIVDYTGATLPAKFLWPNGQAVSRATYAALFAVLSTTYGAGDGSTTFNLPDLRGRVSAGKDNLGGATSAARLSTIISSTTLGAAGGDQFMQAHTHTINGQTGASPENAGTNSVKATDIGAARTPAGLSTTGAGSSENVQPTIILNKIIYAGA